MQNNNNNNNKRKKPGRPKAYDSVKPVELSECLFCFNVFNRSAIHLQQILVHDMDYCPSFWQKEIMNKEYQEENPLDVQIKKFWNVS